MRDGPQGVEMATITLTDEQVADLVQQLPPGRRLGVLRVLADRAQKQRNDRMAYAQQQFRRVAAERGLDWDRMSEDDREQFVDELIHEDRAYHTQP